MKPQFLIIIAIVILSACVSPTITLTPQPVPTMMHIPDATATTTPIDKLNKQGEARAPSIGIETLTATPAAGISIKEEHFIYSVTWSPNGMRIAAHVLSGIEIYNSNTLDLISTIKTPVEYYKFISDDKEIATSGNNGVIEIWEVESGNLLQTIKFEMGITNRFALSHNKELLATSDEPNVCKCIRLLNVKTGQIVNTLKEGSEHFGMSDASSLEFLQDDKFLLAWRVFTDVHIWQIENNQEIFSKHSITSNDGNTSKWLISVAIAPKTNWIAMFFEPIPGAGDHTPPDIKTLTPPSPPQPRVSEIVIQDLNKHQEKILPQIKSLISKSNTYMKVQFSKDESQLILSGNDQVFFWDINNDHLIREIKIEGLKSIHNPDGTKAIIVSNKNYRSDTIEIWDTVTGKIINTKTR